MNKSILSIFCIAAIMLTVSGCVRDESDPAEASAGGGGGGSGLPSGDDGGSGGDTTPDPVDPNQPEEPPHVTRHHRNDFFFGFSFYYLELKAPLKDFL